MVLSFIPRRHAPHRVAKLWCPFVSHGLYPQSVNFRQLRPRLRVAITVLDRFQGQDKF